MSVFRRLYRIRLFLLLGVFVYVAYLFTDGAPWFFVLIGPPIYIAHYIRHFIEMYVSLNLLLNFMSPVALNDYVFLGPITLIYFGFIGFLLKNLQKEHGFVRLISLGAFVLFVGYIHLRAWQSIIGFYVTAL